jgi:small subunit ribosomal protein S2
MTVMINKTTGINESNLEALFKVGAHFGFIKSRRHPSQKANILGVKDKVDVFNLEKTQAVLDSALDFIKDIASKRGMVLFVSSKNEAKSAIMDSATSINQPYVAGRWIGGTITNFPEIRKRVTKLERLLEEKEKGEFGKYTKKERLLIDREIEKMKIYFTGLIPMTSIPKALVVVDTKKEYIAIKEAKDLGIPVVSISGSDCNINDSDFAIPANDSSKTSITYFLSKIVEAYKEVLFINEEITEEFNQIVRTFLNPILQEYIRNNDRVLIEMATLPMNPIKYLCDKLFFVAYERYDVRDILDTVQKRNPELKEGIIIRTLNYQNRIFTSNTKDKFDVIYSRDYWGWTHDKLL